MKGVFTKESLIRFKKRTRWTVSLNPSSHRHTYDNASLMLVEKVVRLYDASLVVKNILVIYCDIMRVLPFLVFSLKQHARVSAFFFF